MTAKRPRLGSIYRRRKRRPDGRVLELPTYWIKYSNHSGQVFRESAQTKVYAEAQRKLRKRLAEIEAGAFAGPQVDRLRIDELLDDLLRDYRINGKSYRDFADPAVRLHLRPYFGAIRTTQLDTPRVQEYILERQRQGAANGTINRETALLKRAFNLGRQQTPPRIRFVPHIPKLKENNVRKGFLEYGEFTALMRALPEHLRPVLAFAFYTGCRVGEILSLKWPQVDLARQVVRLEPGTTKNEDARNFFVPSDLYQVLTMQRAIRDAKYPSCPFVFFKAGNPIGSFYKASKSACKRAGLVDEAGWPPKSSTISGAPESATWCVQECRSEWQCRSLGTEADRFLSGTTS